MQFIVGVEYADGDQHTERSVLDEIENEVTNDIEPVSTHGSSISRTKQWSHKD